MGIDGLFQRIAPVDDRFDLSRLDELFEEEQIPLPPACVIRERFPVCDQIPYRPELLRESGVGRKVAQREGRRLTLEQAIALATEDTSPPSVGIK